MYTTANQYHLKSSVGFSDKLCIETSVVRIFLRMGFYQQSFHFDSGYISNIT